MTYRLHTALPARHPLTASMARDEAMVACQVPSMSHAVLSDNPQWLSRMRVDHPATLRILVDADPWLEQRGANLRFAHHVLTADASGHDISMLMGSRDGKGLEALKPLGRAHLPLLSTSTKRLMAVLDDPEADAVKVKCVIQQDPALVAKILKLANSPIFHRRRTISTLDRAIVLLGLANIRLAAMSVGFFRPIRGVRPRQLEAARDTGLLAVAAVRKLAGAHAEVAATAAMLMDIGKILLFQHDPAYPELQAEASVSDTALCTLERQRYGTTHAEQGARLLSSWGLPFEVCEAIALSHTPFPHPQNGMSVRALVYVASELTEAALQGRPHPQRLSWLVDEPQLLECAEHLSDQLLLAA